MVAANPSELARITALGATVDSAGYIQGEMTPSRAIGDVQFKGGDPDEREGIILPTPELTLCNGVPAGSLLLIASDGLWDALTSGTVTLPSLSSDACVIKSWFHSIFVLF